MSRKCIGNSGLAAMSKRVYVSIDICDHNGTGGYTREPQNTGQCCDGQSFTREVATGLPQRRCAFGAADHGVDRPPGAPRAHGGAVRALGSQFFLSLRLAEGFFAARPGEFALPPWRRSSTKVTPQAEATLG